MIRIFIILFLLLSICYPVYSADTNWIVGSTNTGSTDGDDGIYNTTASMFDENDATYYGSYETDTSSVTTIGNSEFATSHSVNRIRAIFGSLVDGGSTATYLIQAYYSSSWHTIGSGSAASSPQTVDLTGLTLTGVSQVKVTIVDVGYNTGFGWVAASTIYEISAWGTDPAGYSTIY